MGAVKVTVNHNKCVGSQLCAYFMPEQFDMDDNGQSIAITQDVQDITKLLQTAEQCPQCAIQVEDLETGEIMFPPPELAM